MVPVLGMWWPRARYRRVIIGDRNGLARRDGLLKTLAENEPWGENIEEMQ